jgi:TolB protein
MTQALLQQAIDAIRRGDKPAGQRLLAQVLRADPRSETAWLWMSQIVDSDAQRLDCLRRILAINPGNAAARKGIDLLEARERASLSTSRAEARAAPPPPLPAVSPFAEVTTGQATPAQPASIESATPSVELAPAAPSAPAAEPVRAEKKKAAPRRERAPGRRRPLRPIWMALAVVVIGAGIIYAVSATRPTPEAAPIAASTGRLAASLGQEGDTEIVLIDSDGSALTRLTRRPGLDIDPAWSPDGQRIAFAAEIAPRQIAIGVIDANGQSLSLLMPTAGQNVDPAWSPGGRRMAFAADRDGDFDIFVMPVAGPQAQPVEDGALNLTRFEGDDRAPAWLPDGESIVFQSDREGQVDIYRMDADGSNLRRLTDDPAEDSDPAVSPDGRRIAFASLRDGDYDIIVMNLDGSEQRAVTDNEVADLKPAWTPEGSLLFASGVAGSTALFAVEADGSGLRRVGGDALRGVNSAAWQPVDVDPGTLASRAVATPTAQRASGAAPPFALPEGAFTFASNRAGRFGLYRMNLDGSDLRPVSDGAGERHPALSPVANQLALDAPISDTQRVFVLDFTGPEQVVVTLTQATVSAYAPAWSPDGARIAYTIDAERGPDILRVNADGSATARLTDRPGVDDCLSWRPDGEQIAFTSDRDGDLDIYLMDVDGTDVQRLTQHLAADRCPAWSPDGERLAFVSDRSGDGVYLMGANGSNVRLLAAIGDATQPAWSADGKFLLAASDQDGDSDIYLIVVDSGVVWNLTASSDADEVDPMWGP